ncbi:MAG: HAD-IIA family hydrolase [Propionibacteriaceae bacterium]|jgi:HAD superfamily hydrolase (TIGR01450 family)|nr:HAD-IIA family hydrolase [Propionibacteriaceae bacterium]
MSDAWIDGYDAVFFDLDGVIYLGPKAVPGAAAATNELLKRGKRLMYVTNNAARPADTVVAQLRSLGYTADLDMVLTSAQVAAEYLGKELAPGTRILVAGSPNLSNLLAGAGLEPVSKAADKPEAVILGYDPAMAWPLLDEATLAIGAGAKWYATNNDGSRPTDRGLVLGVGGMIAAIQTALGGEPAVFGKPHLPMLEEAVRRTGAKNPVFVGDRVDTDIMGANAAGMDSYLVFTGAHGKRDLVAAGPQGRPTAIGPDVAGLLRAPRKLRVNPGEATCDGQWVVMRRGKVKLGTSPTSADAQYSALWAAANLVWNSRAGDARPVFTKLGLVP